MTAIAFALAASALPAPVAPLPTPIPTPIMIAAPPAPPIVVQVVPPAPASVEVVAPRVRTPGDPYEKFNRRMFRTHQRFDRRFLRPVAKGYAAVVPKFLRSMLRNFFSNLGEPVVFLNYMLQLKPGKAVETVGRFAINSTLGLGGTVDVAKEKNVALPHRSNGLGNTLGFYGVKPGPYLFLPFVGPTNVRDLLGGQVDGLVLPLAVGDPFDRIEYQVPRGVITGLDLRAENDADLNALFDGAVDPYATLRSVYLQDRAGAIAELKGRRSAAPDAPELGQPLADPGNANTSPSGELDDPMADPAAGSAPQPSAGTPDPLADPAATPAPANPPAELEDPLADPSPSADPAAPARK